MIEVTTTCGCQETARKLAQSLLDEHLAACVQIYGPIESVYRWEGQIRVDQEWKCTIKSHRALCDRLIESISAHHTYDVPEILVVAVDKCSASYEDWVRNEVGL